MLTRRRPLFILIIPISLIVVVGMGVLMYWKIQYMLLVSAADNAFLTSRGKSHTDPDSMDFKLHGLRAGMTIDEVDLAMNGSSFQSLRPTFPAGRGMPTGRLYKFEYGTGYKHPFTSRSEPLASENFLVYFDAEGHAVSVLYDRMRYSRGGVHFEEIDLRSRTGK